jgi:hypothetical protein
MFRIRRHEEKPHMSKLTSMRRRLLIAAIVVNILGTIFARARGYSIGPHAVVRCREGHLFTTMWIPGISFKSVRLGWWRIQRCPVGKHWSIVAPVKPADLTKKELRFAEEHRDIRVP